MEMYFVSSYLHHKDNNGWVFKVENRYDTIDAAKKAYHTLLGSYINTTPWDQVSVILTDAFGNLLMREFWKEPVAPAPVVPDASSASEG